MTSQSFQAIESEIPIPDISHLVIEDDAPVDNFQSAKQQRLLVEPLYNSQVLPRPFIADANVGLFYALREDPIVPDVFLSLGVQMPDDWSQKRNRSYFVWEFGKFPEVVVEIVSNRRGSELVSSDAEKPSKQSLYARLGIPYYAVFDPLRQIQEPEQMDGALLKVFGLTQGRYRELIAPFWLEAVGLGLTLWEGEFEDQSGLWLRWCNLAGEVIPTGAEQAAQEVQRANAEAQRANAAEAKAQKLAERLRQLGIDPNEV